MTTVGRKSWYVIIIIILITDALILLECFMFQKVQSQLDDSSDDDS